MLQNRLLPLAALLGSSALAVILQTPKVQPSKLGSNNSTNGTNTTVVSTPDGTITADNTIATQPAQNVTTNAPGSHVSITVSDGSGNTPANTTVTSDSVNVSSNSSTSNSGTTVTSVHSNSSNSTVNQSTTTVTTVNGHTVVSN